MIGSLKERDSQVRVSSKVLSWITRDRPIFENTNEETENISSSDNEDQPQDKKDQQKSLHSNVNLKVLNLDRPFNNTINVQPMNIDSERTDNINSNAMRDGLASIRTGNDFEDEESSTVSDFAYNRNSLSKGAQNLEELKSINNKSAGMIKNPQSARQVYTSSQHEI